MPEGDSIYRAASRLRPVLLGKPIEEALTTKSTIPVSRLLGRPTTAIDTFGKYLLIRFGTFGSIRIHLGMDGRFMIRRVAPAFPPRAPVHLLLLRAGRAWVVCRAPKILEWDTPLVGGEKDPLAGRVGIDLLKDHDSKSLAESMAKLGAVPIASALLRQNVAAGIGNVYKSEVLFRQGIHPETEISVLSIETLTLLLEDAAWLLRRNVSQYSRMRQTRFGLGPRLAVYGRAREPCLRCGARIVRMVDREGARSSYFCPSCQPRA